MTYHDDEGVKAFRGLLVATGLTTVLLCTIILIVWAL